MNKSRKKRSPAPMTDSGGIKDFLDMIAPSVIDFKVDHFLCGNTYRCVWALREYPTSTDEQAILLQHGGSPADSHRRGQPTGCGHPGLYHAQKP